MKVKIKGDQKAVIIKPVLWRQAGFTLFLLTVAAFFSMVSYVGVFFSWVGTIFFFLIGLLNLLDQIFEWSRLKINKNGYAYRGWWIRQHYKHEEIESFSSEIYAGRPLIMINLRKKALKIRGFEEKPIAFPCSFGRPVEDVLETLKQNHDKTPRALI